MENGNKPGMDNNTRIISPEEPTSIRLGREINELKQINANEVRARTAAERERDRFRKERDRYQDLLLVAARFAAQNNDRTGDAQTEFDGHTFSGAELSAFIMDVLEGKE